MVISMRSVYSWLVMRIEATLNRNPASFINRIIIFLFKITSIILCTIKRANFPQRAIGGEWFIYRYRIEFCMEWLEPESIYWVRKLVKPNMTAIDIGAHVGYYTKIISHLVKTNGRVYAFEASPENFSVLEENIKSWHNKNVIFYHYAVSDKKGMVNLHVSPGHSNHSLVEGYTPSENAILVDAVRLDDLLPNKSMDFIKIDVEGHEPHVLNGMRDLIKISGNLVMLVEYNRVALSKAYSSPQILLDLLTELGFTYQAILEDSRLGNIPEGTDTVNLLCTQKSIQQLI